MKASKTKSAASFVYAGISALTLITTIVYIVFSSTWGIRNTPVVLALSGAVILSALLFAIDTAFDSYLEVITSVLIGLGLALFAVSCVGDYTDAISQIVMFGSGAPIGGIIAIDIMMFVSLLTSFVGAGLRKGATEKADAEKSAPKSKKTMIVIWVILLVCVLVAAIVVHSLFFAKKSFSIASTTSEHGSYVFEIKNKEVTTAAENEVVSVYVTPDDGFIFNAITVKGGDTELTTFKSGDNQYSFTMPASNVTVAVKFGYKPTEYRPDDTVASQAGFSTASLLTYADGTFEYTFVTASQEYGATQTRTSYYTGTWSMEGNNIVLSAVAENETYSFTHPRTEAAKSAYDQFCQEHSSEITERLDSANTAYITTTDIHETLTFILDSSAMSFGII